MCDNAMTLPVTAEMKAKFLHDEVMFENMRAADSAHSMADSIRAFEAGGVQYRLKLKCHCRKVLIKEHWTSADGTDDIIEVRVA